jgi:hypothetical protein
VDQAAVADDQRAGAHLRVSRADARVGVTERIVGAATGGRRREGGPARLKIERIGERSGIARRTIISRWTHVRLLFLDAFEEITRLRPLPLVDDLAKDLSTFATEYARELDDPTYFRVLIFLMEGSRDNKQYRARYRAMSRQRQRRAADIVRASVGRGELPRDTDATAVADAVMAPLFHRRVGRHVMLTDRDVAAAVDWVLRTLGVVPAKPHRPASPSAT